MQDIASQLFAYEAGQLDNREELRLCAALIKYGWNSHLQGFYRCIAQDYVLAGLVSPDGDVLAEPEEAW